jgi:hypothetical protein
MLVQRLCICLSSPTLSIESDRSWSKTGRSPVDVSQRHMPHCVQQACSMTHKSLINNGAFLDCNGGGSVTKE